MTWSAPSTRVTATCRCGARAVAESITSSAVRAEVDAFHAAHGVCRQRVAGGMIYHRLVRLLSHLIRNEGVAPDAVERAVDSALKMGLGEQASLTGEGPPGVPASMRRAFVQEQVARLEEG